MTNKYIALLGLAFMLMLSLVSGPLVSSAQTASSTDNNNGSSTVTTGTTTDPTVIETTSTTSATSSTSTTPMISSVSPSNTGDTSSVITFNLSGLSPSTDYAFIGSLWQNGTLLASKQQDFNSGSNGSNTTTGNTTLETSSISGESNSAGDSATITWTTNQNADSQVMFGTTTNYASSSPLDSNKVMNHSLNINNLTPNTLYHFQVVSKDSSGRTSTSSDQTFMTDQMNNNGSGGGSGNNDNGSGTTNINTSNIVGNSSQDGTSATINWTTNVSADSQVVYGTSANNYTLSSALNSNQGTNHSATISGLTPGTVYHFQVMSTDSSGNKTTSGDMILSTNGTNTTPIIMTMNDLQNRIVQLQEQVIALLQQRIQTLITEANNQ